MRWALNYTRVIILEQVLNRGGCRQVACRRKVHRGPRDRASWAMGRAAGSSRPLRATDPSHRLKHAITPPDDAWLRHQLIHLDDIITPPEYH